MTSERSAEQALSAWLSGLPTQDGIRIISTPTHFGGADSGEEGYARQFPGAEEMEQRIGAALGSALEGADTSAPALELGAGTGFLSRPLVTATRYPTYYITDTSPEFLRHTRATIDQLAGGDRAEYVVLSGDELDRWPPGTLSLVALRYTLHHVLDWEHLIDVAGRLLVPGGVLALEEPCADGFLLQAALVNLALRTAGRRLRGPARRDLDFFVATTLFYARGDIDKSSAEDKHVFPLFALTEACRRAGLTPEVFANQGFDNGLNPANSGAGTFTAEFRHNLAVNFGFGAQTVEFFDRQIAPACSELEALDPRTGGPVVKAAVLARKPQRLR